MVREIMFLDVPSGRLPIVLAAIIRSSDNTYLVRHDISVLCGKISVKLGVNIHHMSGHC